MYFIENAHFYCYYTTCMCIYIYRQHQDIYLACNCEFFKKYFLKPGRKFTDVLIVIICGGGKRRGFFSLSYAWIFIHIRLGGFSLFSKETQTNLQESKRNRLDSYPGPCPRLC